LENEKVTGKPLLLKVMKKGRIIYGVPKLEETRRVTLRNLSLLPEKYKKLAGAALYPVELSAGLRKIRDQLERQLRRHDCSA